MNDIEQARAEGKAQAKARARAILESPEATADGYDSPRYALAKRLLLETDLSPEQARAELTKGIELENWARRVAARQPTEEPEDEELDAWARRVAGKGKSHE